MNPHGRSTRVIIALIVAMAVSGLAACGTSSPTPSASKPASSPVSSAPAPSSAAPSPSAAAPASSPAVKPASPEQQAYDKAMQDWTQVVEAARKETQPATLYSVFEQDTLTKLENGFNKVDPKIQVKFMRMTGAVATERIKAEQATKQFVGNLYAGGSPATRPMADQGLGQAVGDLPALLEPGVKWAVQPLLDKPRDTLTVSFVKYWLLYNTNVVPAGQEPRSWKDLADPKWKDKLLLWDPRIPSSGQAALALLYLHPSPDYGPDLVRKIIQNARVGLDQTDILRTVARGEAAVTIAPWQMYLGVKDAPVKMVVPTDGMLAGPYQSLLLKTAPQINTTRVFMNWMLSKDGQRIFSEGTAAIRADVDAITKETQLLPGEAFLPNAPYPWDFEMTKMKEAAKVFGKWLDEMGK